MKPATYMPFNETTAMTYSDDCNNTGNTCLEQHVQQLFTCWLQSSTGIKQALEQMHLTMYLAMPKGRHRGPMSIGGRLSWSYLTSGILVTLLLWRFLFLAMMDYTFGNCDEIMPNVRTGQRTDSEVNIHHSSAMTTNAVISLPPRRQSNRTNGQSNRTNGQSFSCHL